MTGESQASSSLRWIAVLPGALVAALLATFPLHWFLELALAPNPDEFIQLSKGASTAVELALTPFVIAMTLIVTGAAIAPRHKMKIAVALAALYVGGDFALLVFASSVGLHPAFNANTVGALGGIALGLYAVWHQHG